MTTVLDHAPIARNGFARPGPDMVTSIDQAGHTGIDGIYYEATPEGPQYQVVDQKFATDDDWHFGRVVSDDMQLSPNWISRRLDDDFRDSSGVIDTTPKDKP